MKRYRRPKVSSGEIKLQKGKCEYDGVDMFIYFGDGVPKRDRALIFNYICSDNINYSGGKYPSLIEELEKRGYDLDTLRFSVSHKKNELAKEVE